MTDKIKNLLKTGVKSEFVKNTSTLATGTTFAQLIPIFIQPVLRRYYPADIFGVYAVYMSLVGVLYVVAALRYEQAIVLPENDEDAMNLMSLSQLINLSFSVIILIIISLFHSSLASFLNIANEHILFLWFVPAGVFLFNLHQTINLWLIRKKNFLSVSSSKLIRRGSEGFFQLSFRYMKYANGLLVGDFLGHIANIIFCIYQAIKKGFQFRHVDYNKIKKVAKLYSEYPKYNSITTLLNACSLLLPVLIINKYYGADTAGYYDLSRLILLTPIVLLASSISNVMLQRISEKRNNNLFFGKELLLIFLIGSLICIAEIAIILPFGVPLFSFVFGSEWSYSGELSKILIWPYLLYFFTASLNSIFLALREIKQLSIYQTINFLIILSLFLLKELEFFQFIKAFAILYICSSLFFFALLFKSIFKYKKHLLMNDLADHAI